MTDNFTKLRSAIINSDLNTYNYLIAHVTNQLSPGDLEQLLFDSIVQNIIVICKDLISRGADVNSHDESTGFTPLHVATQYKRIEIAYLLLESGGNPNALDVHQNTPLWTATINARGDYRFVQLFLDFGADPRSVNKYGRTALGFAEQIGDGHMIDILLAKSGRLGS